MSAEHNQVQCRAQVVSSCQKSNILYDNPQADPREDSTYDPETKTVICNLCYYAILSYEVSHHIRRDDLNEELDETIALMKKE